MKVIVKAQSPKMLAGQSKAIKKQLPIIVKTSAVNMRNRIRIEIRAQAEYATGKLENSWVTKQIGPLAWSVQSDSIYARMRDLGGPIRPKRAQFLTLPILRSLRGKTPRDFPGKGYGFLRSKKTDQLYFGAFTGQGKNGKKFTPMFRLRKFVRQNGWAYVTKARARWRAEVEKKLTKIGLTDYRATGE